MTSLFLQEVREGDEVRRKERKQESMKNQGREERSMNLPSND
jgi:hypothetical protein